MKQKEKSSIFAKKFGILFLFLRGHRGACTEVAFLAVKRKIDF